MKVSLLVVTEPSPIVIITKVIVKNNILFCYTGRLNQVSVFVNREGVFYGQRDMRYFTLKHADCAWASFVRKVFNLIRRTIIYASFLVKN